MLKNVKYKVQNANTTKSKALNEFDNRTKEGNEE